MKRDNVVSFVITTAVMGTAGVGNAIHAKPRKELKMQPFCHSCGCIPTEWDGPYTCKSCGEGYDEFEQALQEDRVEIIVPEAPQVGDVIDIKITPRK